MTYTLLNVAVLVPVGLLVAVAVRRLPARHRPRWAAVGVAFAALVVLTAVFDNVLIGAGLIAYAEEHRSGIEIGRAPLEDFAYPLASAVALPVLWHVLAWRADRRRAPSPAAAEGAAR